MECNKQQNMDRCTCSYDGCPRQGVCCECIAYHWNNKQLPGCLFPPEAERTYDRSLRKFIEVYKDQV